tara:strand:+ start:362 stop:631 length:270 start_codon:yes stop_codon:yes gene_type:complete
VVVQEQVHLQVVQAAEAAVQLLWEVILQVLKNSEMVALVNIQKLILLQVLQVLHQLIQVQQVIIITLVAEAVTVTKLLIVITTQVVEAV